jgi:hypothetical protein
MHADSESCSIEKKKVFGKRRLKRLNLNWTDVSSLD